MKHLWGGISPCMTPGIGECVVWWEAWAVGVALLAVFVAFAALVVSFWGVIATVISSIAIWRLGQKANHLAESGAEQVRIERNALADMQVAEREREAVIVLSYISSELSAIYPSVAAMRTQLNQEGAEERFVTSMPWRKVWADDLGKLETPRMDSVLQLLYRLPSNMGRRVARVLGDVQTLQDIMKATAAQGLTREDTEQERQVKERWLRTLYTSARHASERAAADIQFCTLEAARTSVTIGNIPTSN